MSAAASAFLSALEAESQRLNLRWTAGVAEPPRPPRGKRAARRR
jgi:hypothetical protein